MFFVDTITKSCRERLVKELSLLFLRKNNNLNYFLYHCQPYNCSKGSKKNDNCYILSSHIKDKNS